MQFPGQAPVVGVVYITTMSRPDSALALALLYGLQGKREARLGAISVSGAGLTTAAYCDAVGRFYSPGPASNSNRVLPIGLAAEGGVPASDPPMVVAAMKREFVHTTRSLGDTSEPTALIRNALTAQADGYAVVVLSGPATHLARTLDLQGARELIKAKVRALVVCDTGTTQDTKAMRRILAEWPTRIVLCPAALGETVRFPAASIEKDFAWSEAHPVIDAYKAYRAMPYDASTLDMAAMLYAVRPNTEFFRLSDPCGIAVNESGKLETRGTSGKDAYLIVNSGKAEALQTQFVELASAKPTVPVRRGPPPKPALPPVKSP